MSTQVTINDVIPKTQITATAGQTVFTTNWTANLTFSSSTSVNTALSTGQSTTVAVLASQGSTPYYSSAVQIDGTSITPYWQGGSAPSKGNASGYDVYTYTIIKTSSTPKYTVLETQTQF